MNDTVSFYTHALSAISLQMALDTNMTPFIVEKMECSRKMPSFSNCVQKNKGVLTGYSSNNKWMDSGII